MSEADATFSPEGRKTAALTHEERTAIAKWYTADFPECNGMPLQFAAVAAKVACEKWSAIYGTKLVAMMADRGHLRPGQNPVDAMLDLLENL